jgi:tetratricopeptide (TPR) repeat protein
MDECRYFCSETAIELIKNGKNILKIEPKKRIVVDEIVNSHILTLNMLKIWENIEEIKRVLKVEIYDMFEKSTLNDGKTLSLEFASNGKGRRYTINIETDFPYKDSGRVVVIDKEIKKPLDLTFSEFICRVANGSIPAEYDFLNRDDKKSYQNAIKALEVLSDKFNICSMDKESKDKFNIYDMVEKEYLLKKYVEFAQFYQCEMENRLKEAEDLYKKALELDKNSENLLSAYGSFLMLYKEDYKKAKKIYKRLIKLNPTLKNYENLATIYNSDHLNRPKKLAKIYKTLTKKEPENLNYKRVYGETIAFTLNRPKKALKLFKEVLRRRGEEDDYLNYILALKLSGTKDSKLQKILKKASDKFPDSRYIQKNYLEFLMSQGEVLNIDELLKDDSTTEIESFIVVKNLLQDKRFDDAYRGVEIALNRFPDSDRLMVLKLQLLIERSANNKEIIDLAKRIQEVSTNEKIKRKTQAIIKSREVDLKSIDKSQYTDLIESKKGDIKALMVEAGEALMAQDFKKSLALTEAIEKISPYDNNMLMLYASILKVTKGKNSSIEFLKEKAQKGESVNPYILLIQLLIEEDKNRAKEIYLKAKETFPEDETLKELSHLFEEDIKANSKKEFKALIEKNPDSIRLNKEYAIFLFENSEYKEAIEQYKRAVELNPNDITNYMDISQLYEIIGEIKKSEEYALKALDIAPTKFLNLIFKIDMDKFEKYLNIAKDRFKDDKDVQYYIKMSEKMLQNI